MLINKKQVRQFIKENSTTITQIECTFYSALESKVRDMIKKAIENNRHRKRLTQYELLS